MVMLNAVDRITDSGHNVLYRIFIALLNDNVSRLRSRALSLYDIVVSKATVFRLRQRSSTAGCALSRDSCQVPERSTCFDWSGSGAPHA